ncbi:MAG: NfeD family protein [Planctomycetota bacterium]
MRRREKPINLLLTMLGLGLMAAGLLSTLLPVTDLNAQDPPESEPPAKPLRSGVRVYIVPIHGGIGTQTVLYVKRSIEAARADKAEFFILDIDTPGGLSSAMEEIGEDIADLEEMTTVAFVNTDAASAGSYISLSCDRIVMAEGSQVGSAALIFIGPDGSIIEMSEEIREKMVSHARAAFRKMAKRKGRSPDLAEAMVDWRIWIKYFKIRSKDGTERIEIVRTEDEVEFKSKLPEGDEIIEEDTIVDDKHLVNLDYEEAVKYGFADKWIKGNDRETLFEYLGLVDPDVTEAEPTFTEGFFAFLNSPLLRTLLIMIGLAGIYLELKTPGFGVPGIVGLSAIAMIMLISFVIGTANIWEVLLVFIGVILLAVEVFVIPGFGITGILGIACIFFGIILTLVPFTIPRTDWAWGYLLERVRDLVAGFVASLVAFFLLIRLLPKTSIFRRLELLTTASAEEGFIVPSEEMKALLGRTGVAVTKLRPVGKAEFGNRQFQVVAEGDLLDAGDEVEVIDVSGNKVTVRKVEQP